MVAFEYRQAEEIRDALARHGVRYLFSGVAPPISRVAVRAADREHRGWADQEVRDVEDDVLLETARSHIEKVAKREQDIRA